MHEELRGAQSGDRLEIAGLTGSGWTRDVLDCVNRISETEFVLNDVYRFEAALSQKYPGNHNVRAKIRQQLQILRDDGYIEFLGNGHYRKLP